MTAETNVVREIFDGVFPHELIDDIMSYNDTNVDNSVLLGSRVFTNTMRDILPREMIDTIISFHGTDYDAWYDNYTWEEVEAMVDYFMSHGVDCCDHIFGMFNSMGQDLQRFYPNATTDNSVKRNVVVRYDKDVDEYNETHEVGVSFDRLDWFMPDFFQNSGKRWYLDDEGTNYEGIVFMITRTLKKFDEWYWRNYTGRSDNQLCMVENIVQVYTTLEKYYDMTSDEIYADANIQRASPYGNR